MMDNLQAVKNIAVKSKKRKIKGLGMFKGIGEFTSEDELNAEL